MIRFIRRATEICLQRYGGDVPEKYEDILELPGVGPKMAHLLLQKVGSGMDLSAETEMIGRLVLFIRVLCVNLLDWLQHGGIGVDVHVHRISQRLGWTRGAKQPEDTARCVSSCHVHHAQSPFVVTMPVMVRSHSDMRWKHGCLEIAGLSSTKWSALSPR